MNLGELIEEGSAKAGGQRRLALAIGVEEANLSAAKKGKRGLPSHACMRLSEIIDVDLKQVLAASELTTAKDEKVRAYLLPFVKDTARHAAGLAGAFLLATVTTVVSSSDASASDSKGCEAKADISSLYYVK